MHDTSLRDLPPASCDTIAAARKPWTTPRLARLQSGSAELGANPAVGEGAFAKGS